MYLQMSRNACLVMASESDSESESDKIKECVFVHVRKCYTGSILLICMIE